MHLKPLESHLTVNPCTWVCGDCGPNNGGKGVGFPVNLEDRWRVCPGAHFPGTRRGWRRRRGLEKQRRNVYNNPIQDLAWNSGCIVVTFLHSFGKLSSDSVQRHRSESWTCGRTSPGDSKCGLHHLPGGDIQPRAVSAITTESPAPKMRTAHLKR